MGAGAATNSRWTKLDKNMGYFTIGDLCISPLIGDVPNLPDRMVLDRHESIRFRFRLLENLLVVGGVLPPSHYINTSPLSFRTTLPSLETTGYTRAAQRQAFPPLALRYLQRWQDRFS